MGLCAIYWMEKERVLMFFMYLSELVCIYKCVVSSFEYVHNDIVLSRYCHSRDTDPKISAY